MLVFPATDEPDDDTELPDAGESKQNPEVYSAAWYLKQIIIDDIVFTQKKDRKRLMKSLIASKTRTLSGSDDDDPTELLSPKGSYSNPSVIDSLMADVTKNADEVEQEWIQSQALSNERNENNENNGKIDSGIKGAYLHAKYAKTKRELKRCIVNLILRYALCEHCGFEVRAFSSVDQDEIFVSLGACDDILRAHADMLEYKLQLSSTAAVSILGNRFKQDEFSPPYMKYDVDDEEMYATNDKMACQTPYRIFYDTFQTGSIFHNADRARIMSAILEKSFNLPNLIAFGFLKYYYPLHNQLGLKPLTESWAKLRLWQRKAAVPLDEICVYFGAKVAFRISFLRFLTYHIMPLAMVALLALFVSHKQVSALVLGCLLMVWAATAEEFWKRSEVGQLMQWGMEDFEESDRLRPEFYGVWSLSRADRLTLVKSYPAWKHGIRRSMTAAATLLFNVLVVTTTIFLYGYHDELAHRGAPKIAVVSVNIVIALQIQLYNSFWSWAAAKLTDFDNYETKSQYGDALVLRVFTVYFVTSFCSLFYIAFVKHYLVGCTDATCNLELASALRTLFIINMLFHFLSMALPYISFRVQLWLESRGMATGTSSRSTYRALPEENHAKKIAPKAMCYPEAQAKMNEYSLAEEITDRMDVWVELGYVLFFGLVAPEVILLFLLSNLFRIHATGWKLAVTMRRPFPEGSAGIGKSFSTIFSIMSHCAVASNIVLLLIQNSAGPEGQDLLRWLKLAVGNPAEGERRDLDWKLMFGTFWLLERCVASIRLAIDSCIPDIPHSVQLQRQRREAVQRELQAMSVSALKKWEGQELQRAYEATRVGKECVLVLTGYHTWALTAPELVASSACNVPPWSPEDPDFEQPWLTQETTGDLQRSLQPSRRLPAQVQTTNQMRSPRLLYSF